MRDYLVKMKATPYMAPGPKTEPPVVLAGILPKMVELAATETEGSTHLLCFARTYGAGAIADWS